MLTIPTALRRGLLTLTTVAAVVPLATSTAADAADRPAVRVTEVAGASAATPEGTAVATAFTVVNRSQSRKGAGTASVFLVAVERTPGPQRSYLLGTTPTPALKAGGEKKVRANFLAPPNTVEGSYRLRVCLAPRPGGPCTVSKKVVAEIGGAVLEADPTALQFAATDLGAESATQDVVVTNTGQSRTNQVTVSLAGTDAGDFGVRNSTCGAKMAPGEVCTVTVAFVPLGETAGTRSATLTVSGQGRGSVDVELTGEATVPANPLEIRPASYDYGQVTAGSATASHTFELANDGDTDLQLFDGTIDPSDSAYFFDFAEGQNTCLSFVVPAHGSCTFSIGFNPQSPGTFTATTTFQAGGYSASSALTGSAVSGDLRSPGTRPAARTRHYLDG